jgi:dihydropteroate synthase
VKLRCKERVLALDRTAIMGVLNVTPDSFSDGGLWLDPEAAIEHGMAMAAEGAAIIDVGGESTRPGAAAVPEEEELKRVLPVIEGLAVSTDAIISVDTRKPRVAHRAVEAGASIINDTSGEIADHAMDDVVLDTGAAIAIMHSRGTPADMRSLINYEDVVTDVSGWLQRRALQLETQGVQHEAIALDPGIGFAKSSDQSLSLLKDLDRFVDLGFPILVGTSRKSFIGAVLDLPEDQRLEGTAATVAWSVIKGARIVRVHDVGPMARVVKMIEAIMDAKS